MNREPPRSPGQDLAGALDAAIEGSGRPSPGLPAEAEEQATPAPGAGV
jgi:hypothetical protein